jgi:DNA invertase Pin-like site-specific DNA recombinase
MASIQGSKPVFDISARVSRQGNRQDERMYSGENQVATCTEFIASKGGEVGLVVNELNVSGGKLAKDRAVEKLVQRIESGDSAGIVVYDFSRLTRENAFAATMLVGRIHLAGGVVYGVADNFDSSAPMAAVMTAMHAEQAHAYLTLSRARTTAGRHRARERGAYITRTPTGYDRTEDGKLVPGEHATLIPLIFARRLTGESYTKLAQFARSEGLRITHGGIRSLLANLVYIGQSTSGVSPPLVDAVTFARVQAMPRLGKAPEYKARTLTQGLATCANCGANLIFTKTSRTDVFYCRGQKIGGCDKRACITVALLDRYVEKVLLAAFREDGVLARARADHTALVETAKLREEALAGVEEITRSTSLISSVGIATFEQMVADAVAARDLAEAAHEIAKANADTLSVVAGLIDEWDSYDLHRKRQILTSAVEAVLVGGGRRSVQEKAQVIFVGGVSAPSEPPSVA